MRNVSYTGGQSVLLPALEAPGVEEVDCRPEDPPGEVREEDGERLLVSTAALTAGERGQQGPEVRGLTEDHPVGLDWDSLTAVEDQVGPPLLSHLLSQVLQHTGHHPPPVILASPPHHCHVLLSSLLTLLY